MLSEFLLLSPSALLHLRWLHSETDFPRSVTKVATHKFQVYTLPVYQSQLNKESQFTHYSPEPPRNDSYWADLSHMSIPEPITSQEEEMIGQDLITCPLWDPVARVSPCLP